MHFIMKLYYLCKRFHRCDRGQALTEYSIAMVMIVPLCIFLFTPDNHFIAGIEVVSAFEGIRVIFDDIRLLILLPGP